MPECLPARKAVPLKFTLFYLLVNHDLLKVFEQILQNWVAYYKLTLRVPAFLTTVRHAKPNTRVHFIGIGYVYTIALIK